MEGCYGSNTYTHRSITVVNTIINKTETVCSSERAEIKKVPEPLEVRFKSRPETKEAVVFGNRK